VLEVSGQAPSAGASVLKSDDGVTVERGVWCQPFVPVELDPHLDTVPSRALDFLRTIGECPRDPALCTDMPDAHVLRFDTPPARLRATAFIEGCSFLLLLGVAMPLKYMAGMPLAVTLVGAVHGVLFIALAVLTLQAIREREKTFAWGVRIGVASLIPFATFALDRDLREDDAAWRRNHG